jgi:hypothetical protein
LRPQASLRIDQRRGGSTASDVQSQCDRGYQRACSRASARKSSGLRFPGDGSGFNVSVIGGNPRLIVMCALNALIAIVYIVGVRVALSPTIQAEWNPVRRQPSPAASIRLSPPRSRDRHAFNTTMRAGLALGLTVGGLEARPRDGRALSLASAKPQKVHPDPGPPPLSQATGLLLVASRSSLLSATRAIMAIATGAPIFARRDRC